MEISKEQFMRYEKAREIGAFNMLDLKRGMNATGLTEEEYKYIISNYGILHKQYMGVK